MQLVNELTFHLRDAAAFDERIAFDKQANDPSEQQRTCNQDRHPDKMLLNVSKHVFDQMQSLCDSHAEQADEQSDDKTNNGCFENKFEDRFFPYFKVWVVEFGEGSLSDSCIKQTNSFHDDFVE